MSVNFHVRRVNARALAALRRNPTLTAALCDPCLDFDPDDYERGFLAATPPPAREGRPAGFERRLKTMVDDRDAARSALDIGGIDTRDLGAALHLERSWWGMESMIGTPTGRRLIAEGEGEPLGEDVGYGPARLLAASELPPILAELDRVKREETEPRFRAHAAAESARRNLPPATDEEFERWSWKPFCDLRDFVRATISEDCSVLRWYD